jgi:hypothetical protein
MAQDPLLKPGRVVLVRREAVLGELGQRGVADQCGDGAAGNQADGWPKRREVKGVRWGYAIEVEAGVLWFDRLTTLSNVEGGC